jgi:hypothetical protein
VAILDRPIINQVEIELNLAEITASKRIGCKFVGNFTDVNLGIEDKCWQSSRTPRLGCLSINVVLQREASEVLQKSEIKAD